MFARLRPSRLAGALVALAGVLSLAACALPGVNATPDAAVILKNVQAVQINDAAFSFSYSGKLSNDAATFLNTNFSVSATGTLTGSGLGKITANPQRADITFNVPISNVQVPIDLLYDGSTKTVYAGSTLISTLAGSSTKTWFQLSLSQLGGFDVTPFLNYTQILNVSVVDTNSLNGVSVYHLQGTESATSSATIDLYVRQDNYNPVRAVITLNTLIVGTATLDFTGINTGFTITPPTADQIFNS